MYWARKIATENCVPDLASILLLACSLFKLNLNYIKHKHTSYSKKPQPSGIPHICHFLYTGRIFKFQILHPKITRIYPKKSKYVFFLRSIWKNLHLTEFFTRAAPVVPVTNMVEIVEAVFRKNR